AAGACGFFSASPTSGPSGSSITLTPVTSSLAVGVYTCLLTFSAAGAPNNVVTVTLNVAPNAVTMGETNIVPTDDSGNANLLVAQSATLAAQATIQSLSFYVTAAGGNLRLGIYDSTGPSGGPGAKKAETNQIVPAVGWNTANVTAPVDLPAGTYWL